MIETLPVGVPLAEPTLTVAETWLPWMIEDGERVSVVALAIKLAFDQLLTRFAAFTLPSPVARSYPAVLA